MPHYTKRFEEYREKHHAIYGTAEIETDWNAYDNSDHTARAARIYTKRLTLSGAKLSDMKQSYEGLYSNPEVMKLYESGKVADESDVNNLFCEWDNRWKNKNPFSGFVIHKNEDGSFVGNVAIEESEYRYSAEISCIFTLDCMRQGYGKEVSAVMFDWIPYLVEEGFKLHAEDDLRTVVATAQPCNIGSGKIIEGLGLKKYYTGLKWGALRDFYKMDIVEEVEAIGLDTKNVSG